MNFDQTDKARTRIIIANADPDYCDDMEEIIRQLNPDADVVVISVADRQIARSRRDMPEPDHLDRLSARQRDVLALIVEGHSNKDIARNLQIAPSTVRVHVSALLRVLGVKSRTAAAAMAAGTFTRRQDPVRSS
ncbi:MAG: LuxR C-terminal-related transcriptional regulator [Paracoccus sp. (in: a-proteobacteria)]|nr:LuxR C-terminal-related transcriptional regulator [Paracoccus sp. (in: a-proteobacteria)]